eukprot:2239363-Prymnesium_polylepis.1
MVVLPRSTWKRSPRPAFSPRTALGRAYRAAASTLPTPRVPGTLPPFVRAQHLPQPTCYTRRCPTLRPRAPGCADVPP